MGFGTIGRCFGKMPEGTSLNLEEVKRKLKEGDMEFFGRDREDSWKFEYVEVGQVTALRRREFLTVLTKVSARVKRYIPTIDVDVNEITPRQQYIEESLWLPFWVFEDGVMFAKAEKSREFLLPFIKRKLGIDVTIPHYDVQRLYNDEKGRGTLMGTGFSDRAGAISAGSLFGEIDEDDAMLEEIEGADKNFVFMKFTIDGEEVKGSVP